MKLSVYLSTLLPLFTRDRMTEDWHTNAEILDNYVLPSYESAAEYFKATKLKSPDAKRYDDMFHHQCRVLVNHNENLVVGIYKCLLQLKKVIVLLEQRTETEFGSDVAKAALTYRQANLLQLQEATGFVLKYAQLLLRYVYVAEATQYKDSDVTLLESIKPADHDTLKAGFTSFTGALNILVDPKQDFGKGLDEIPDIVIKPEAMSGLQSTLGRKLDPFHVGFLPPLFNPIYHVRMLVAEWQTNRFHKAQAEQALMQTHLLHLKKLESGKPDAKLRQEIQYYEDQVDKSSAKLADMEKTYAAAA
jgi:hypothetical protein